MIKTVNYETKNLYDCSLARRNKLTNYISCLLLQKVNMPLMYKISIDVYFLQFFL